MRDVHSYSDPDKVRVRHIDLQLEPAFRSHVLSGAVILDCDVLTQTSDAVLVLDTRDLLIDGVEISSDGHTYEHAQFELGARDDILGSPLNIRITGTTKRARITYSTTPDASGLQWLDPSQTAGKTFPYLFTQSQEIHARSWIPLQDTPAARITYTAKVRTPGGMTAVMSANRVKQQVELGIGTYDFEIKQSIPPYLIALAVGDIKFRPTGRRTGVFAEAQLLEAAAWEFGDAEEMLQAAEDLYGPYRWGRCDILVLPPSFPFGGMENPEVIFVTPTLIAGDKSLVSVVAHEIAHAWAGNLVTNATWSDLWLNEGFTTYIENRIVEQIYGRPRAKMEQVLEKWRLQEELEKLETRDQVLHLDLTGRDPDAGSTLVPYAKGAFFLRYLERVFGRRRLDEFLRDYFDEFAFQSITTKQALKYLNDRLLSDNPLLVSTAEIEDWVTKPGLPASIPQPMSEALNRVGTFARRWLESRIDVHNINAKEWSMQEWVYFLTMLPLDIGTARMEQLDRAFNLTDKENIEILHRWLLMSIRSGYHHAYPRLERFLMSVGRKIYVQSLYEELLKSVDGRAYAERIYAKASPRYHSITRTAVAALFKKSSGVSRQ